MGQIIKTDDAWNFLVRFESRDFVFSWYKRHNEREPNVEKIRDITASFVQAREYFVNAGNADLSVRPLLQYYGVSAFSRALVLLFDPKTSASLKESHGLKTIQWKQTLAGGGDKFLSLEIEVGKGLFSDLLAATKNLVLLKIGSSGIGWGFRFPPPVAGMRMKFEDLAACILKVADEFSIATRRSARTLTLKTFQMKAGENAYECSFGQENALMTLNSIVKAYGLDPKTAIEQHDKSFRISVSAWPFFVEEIDHMFVGSGMGDTRMMAPIGGNTYLNTLGIYFAISYILGMATRYHPSLWVWLGRQEKGDAVFPLVNRLVRIMQERFPISVSEFLEHGSRYMKGQKT